MAGIQNFKTTTKKNLNAFEEKENYNKNFNNIIDNKEFIEKVKLYASYYRAFPYKFCEDYLNINLKLFQKILLYSMMHSYFFMFIASRGLGKTWLTAVFCICRAILYPGTKIILSSGNKSQAVEIITYINEIKKNSDCLNREISYLTDNINNAKVEFYNGSWIRVVASNDGARSKRCNLLIVDEFRMVSKEVVDTVLRKFKANPRQPGYLNKPEYKHLAERNIEIYMSSAYYKNHWSYDKFKAYFNAMMKGKKYFLCDLSYQISILEGLRLKEEVLDEMSEDDFDEYKWKMEMEGIWLGAIDGAFFKLEELQSNRTMVNPIYPKSYYNLIKDGSFKYPRKRAEKGEIRIISCDIALMGGKANDSSAYTVIQIIPNEDGTKYIRKIIYMEIMTGHSTIQAIRIQRLFKELECDYIVLDTNGVGGSIYDQLCQDIYDKETQEKYSALSCMNDERMAIRCLVSNAPKRIFSVKATAQFNSDCACALKDILAKKKLELLIAENDGKQVLKNIKGFSKIPLETQAKFLFPYIQTTSFINETINLKAEINTDTGLVKLKEPRSGRKDRYSSISYGNYFINVLERNLQEDNNYDSDEQLVFYD